MRSIAALGTAATLVAAAPPLPPGGRAPPYWASLRAGEARMRSGPGRIYPATWLYRRKGLPVRVVEVYPGWRKVADPDGTAGWMIQNLVSSERTAMVTGGVAELRDAPSVSARIAWRAEPGVVGALSHCAAGWCRLDVGARGGFVPAAHLWGVDPNETVD